MLTTPGCAAGLKFVARDSNATKRPPAEAAIPGPESPSAAGASAAPRATSVTSPTAACARIGVSATRAASSAAPNAAKPTEPPARPPLMLSRIERLGAAGAASAAGLRHADTDPTALQRHRRVLRAGARPVDHVHEALGLPAAQRVARRVHGVVRSPPALDVLDDRALRLR